MTMTFPEWVEPMAATLTQERFTGPEWIFERKLDGIRLLAFKQGPDVRLFSRNRLPQNIPAVADAIADLPLNDMILDGEITWAPGQVAYHVFDILWLEGRDVTSLPLHRRRALLSALPFRSPLERVEALDDPTPWERACREGWEGVIAKRRDAPYEHRRSPHWLKMKCEASQELVVGGFTDPQGGRVGLGALLVGYYEQDDVACQPKLEGQETERTLACQPKLEDQETERTLACQPKLEGQETERTLACQPKLEGQETERTLACQPKLEGQETERTLACQPKLEDQETERTLACQPKLEDQETERTLACQPKLEDQGTERRLVFAGKVGTGFDTRLLLDLRARLDALEMAKPPFTKAVGLPRVRAHWVRPEIVVQVAFIEWTVNGKLRHSRLLGVRTDKSAREVVRET